MLVTVGDGNDIHPRSLSAERVGNGESVENALDLDAVDELPQIVMDFDKCPAFQTEKVDIEFAVVGVGVDFDSRL